MIQVGGVTDKGVVRTQNQDSYYLKPGVEGGPAVAIVCDGMGGARAGNVASELAVTAAAAYLESLSPEELVRTPGEHLERAASQANEVILQRACHDPDCGGMGTTMVAALVWEDRAILLNIGDSRAYQVNSDGIRKVTRDHSLVEELVAQGEITPEQARRHPQKNLITRALGSEPTARADLYELALRQGDFLLLCSDGLSNVLTDSEIFRMVTEGNLPESSCRRMLDMTLSRGAPDNVTAVLISIGE